MPQRKNNRKKEKTRLNNQPARVDFVEGEVADGLTQEDRNIIKGTFFSEPLPPPDDFNKYPAEVQKAIVQDARAQMKHRHSVESKVVDSDSFVVKVGFVDMLIIYLFYIASAIYLLSTDKRFEGFVMGDLCVV